MLNILPVFQHPTTIVWVDDDNLFLQTVKAKIQNSHKQEMFDSPIKLIKFMENYTQPLSISKFLCIDHNHETGVVRKLLCGHCNKMIGFARESVETLANGIKYLNLFT